MFLIENDLQFIKDEYESKLIHKDKYINIISKDSVREVFSKGIDEMGFLVVLDEGVESRISSGEISLRM